METLRNCEIGDVVWYVASGCPVNPSSEVWDNLKALFMEYSAVFFQYWDIDYGWHKNIPKTDTADVSVNIFHRMLPIKY